MIIMKGAIDMKKAYVKPELDARTFAQFENVFTACTRNTNNPSLGVLTAVNGTRV